MPATGVAHPSTEGFVPVPDFAWACDLYDHRFYWEAHEVWEAEWAGLPRDTPEALFLQGLICGAAAVVKHHQGAVEGGRRLFERAGAAFDGATSLGPVVRCVALAAHLAEVDAYLRGGGWPRVAMHGT